MAGKSPHWLRLQLAWGWAQGDKAGIPTCLTCHMGEAQQTQWTGGGHVSSRGALLMGSVPVPWV